MTTVLRIVGFPLLLTVAAGAQTLPARQPVQGPATTQGANLPVQKIGRDDLLNVAVYYAPELSVSVRVEPDGTIRMPMLSQRLAAEGLLPSELESAIGKALVAEGILANPFVTVSVLEYRSRPITVSGAVKTPITFQETGTMSLLDAITAAGGLAENAGPEILITRRLSGADAAGPPSTQHINTHALLSSDDGSANLTLQGGENIRVPIAGQVYVVGQVKKPGSFYLTDGSQSSVMKALALSGGLDAFPQHTAYIYRTEAGKADRSEIPIQLNSILKRKASDVPLVANDILYVPDASGQRITSRVLQNSLGMSVGIANLLLYAHP